MPAFLSGGMVLVAIFALSVAAWGAAAWTWLQLRARERLPGRGALGFVLRAAATATLLGLLGTVLGMIDVFEALRGDPALRMPRLASGIARALTTTQAGLVVAIPLYVVHAALQARFARVERRFRRA